MAQLEALHIFRYKGRLTLLWLTWLRLINYINTKLLTQHASLECAIVITEFQYAITNVYSHVHWSTIQNAKNQSKCPQWMSGWGKCVCPQCNKYYPAIEKKFKSGDGSAGTGACYTNRRPWLQLSRSHIKSQVWQPGNSTCNPWTSRSRVRKGWNSAGQAA